MKLNKMIKGNVQVRAKGKQVGRFLSILAARGVLYENVIYEEDGILMEMPARKFKDAIICCKKTGMRLRILSKNGMPFFLFRQRRKKWTMLMILPIILSIFCLPGYIWSIEIQGLENISQIEMMTRLEKVGVREGVKQNKISLKEVEKELLLTHKDLSFISLSMEGTNLKITVKETVNPPKTVDRIESCDLVAQEKCIIYSIITEQGTPAVRAGDVVQAGDILIQGNVIQKMEDGSEKRIEAHASGEVYGKVIWSREAEIEKKYTEKVYCPEINKGLNIWINNKCFKIRWPFGKKENESMIEEEVWRSPFGRKVTISKAIFAGYECKETEYTDGQMEERLREKLKYELLDEIKDGNKIVLKEFFTIQHTKTGMKAVLEVEMMQEVGIKVPCKGDTAEE